MNILQHQLNFYIWNRAYTAMGAIENLKNLATRKEESEETNHLAQAALNNLVREINDNWEHKK